MVFSRSSKVINEFYLTKIQIHWDYCLGVFSFIVPQRNWSLEEVLYCQKFHVRIQTLCVQMDESIQQIFLTLRFVPH